MAEAFARGGFPTRPMAFSGLGALLAPVALASDLNKLGAPAEVRAYSYGDVALALNARRLMRDAAGVRVVLSEQGADSPRRSPAFGRLLGELDAIEFTGEGALRAFAAAFPEVKAERLRVVARAVEAPHPAPAKPAAPPVRIAFTGRIAPDTGLDILIDALADHTEADWRLTVCGSGRGRDVMPIVRAARSYGINDRIDWRGYVEDVGPVLAEAHIAVVPYRRIHVAPMAAVEALAMGCRVIAPDTAVMREAFGSDPAVTLLAEFTSSSLRESLAIG